MNVKILIGGAAVAVVAAGILWYFYGRGGGLSAIQPAECLVYWIEEIDPDHSQLIAVDLQAKTVRPIGPVYQHAEFDGLDIHPETGIIYTTATKEGDIYALDARSGERSLLGASNIIGVNSLAFHPGDKRLWAWAEGRGLISMDPATWEARVEHESLEIVIALAWNNEGTLLYATTDEQGELFAYNLAADTFELLSAETFPLDTEGVSPLQDGTILGMRKDEDEGITALFTYDPETFQVIEEAEVTSQGHIGSAGVAWFKACGNPL